MNTLDKAMKENECKSLGPNTPCAELAQTRMNTFGCYWAYVPRPAWQTDKPRSSSSLQLAAKSFCKELTATDQQRMFMETRTPDCE